MALSKGLAMMRDWLRPPRPQHRPRRLRLGDDAKIYAIGDIHGQAEQLAHLLDWLGPRVAEDMRAAIAPIIVFLGDYVDRGPHSRAVIDTLCALPTRWPGVEWVFLAGNHETSMLAFLERPQNAQAWLSFGGDKTLSSYGISPPERPSARSLVAIRDRLAQALPSPHLAFLRQTAWSYASGDYFFCHAGIRPRVPLERQSHEDLTWIRQDFLDNESWLGKCVVHGHSTCDSPEVLPHRICVDTGAYAGGPLTCLVLSDETRATIGFTAGGRQIHQTWPDTAD